MKRQVEERELNQFHIHMNLCQMHATWWRRRRSSV